MAVRLRKKWFSGELGTDDDLNGEPGGWYSDSDRTTDLTTDSTVQVISRSITVDDDRVIHVTVSYRVSCDDTGTFCTLILKRDGNIIGYPCRFTAPADDAQCAASFTRADRPGVAGTYVYSVDLVKTSGTNHVWVRADSDSPFQLITTDQGAA